MRRWLLVSQALFVAIATLPLTSTLGSAEEPADSPRPPRSIRSESGFEVDVKYMADAPGFEIQHPRGDSLLVRGQHSPVAIRRSARGARYSFVGWHIDYETLAMGVKEDIVLETSVAPNRFRFSLGHGHTGVRREHDGFVLQGPDLEPLFRLGPVKAWDANGDPVDVQGTIQKSLLDVELDPADLATAKYPITIDPSVVVAAESAAESGRPNERRVLKTQDDRVIHAFVRTLGVGAPVITYADAPYINWSSQELSGYPCASELSAAIDTSDNIHIVSSCNVPSGVTYVEKVFYQKLSAQPNGWTSGPITVLASYAREPGIAIASNGRIFISYQKRQTGIPGINELQVIRSTAVGWSAPQTLVSFNSATEQTRAYSSVVAFTSPPRIGVLYNDTLNTLQWRYAMLDFNPDATPVWELPQLLGSVLYDRFGAVTGPTGHIQLGWFGQIAGQCQLFVSTCGDGLLTDTLSVLGTPIPCQLSTGEFTIDGPILSTTTDHSYMTYSRAIGIDQWQLTQIRQPIGSSGWEPPQALVEEEKLFDSVYRTSGGIWYDETFDASSMSENDVPFFGTVGDLLQLESSKPFDFIRFRLGTAASASVNATISYWNGVSWVGLETFTDTTANMRQSGFIEFARPADWVPGPTSSRYKLRLTRSASSVVFAPVATQITPIRANRNPVTLDKDPRTLAGSAELLPAFWTTDRYPLTPRYEIKMHARDFQSPKAAEFRLSPGALNPAVSRYRRPALSVKLTDNYAGLAPESISFKLYQGSLLRGDSLPDYDALSETATHTFPFDLEDGLWSLKVEGSDRQGNLLSASWPFTVDTSLIEGVMFADGGPPCGLVPCGVPPILPCDNPHFELTGGGLPASPASETYYTSTQNVSGTLGSSAITDIEQAFDVWSSGSNDCSLAPSSSFNFVRAAETPVFPSLFLATPVRDGINEVAFIDFSSLVDQPTLETIADVRCFPDPQDAARCVEFDMVLDSTELWGTTTSPGTYDVWNVVTNQVGIVTGLRPLGDLLDASLTMFERTWPGDTGKRSLGKGDVLGLEAVSANRPS